MTILEQESKLRELQQSLKQRNIDLHWSLSPSLHDREVRLDTGWVVKIGRGLDIFKPPEGKMVLGYFDLGLRKCLETTVDIFFKKWPQRESIHWKLLQMWILTLCDVYINEMYKSIKNVTILLDKMCSLNLQQQWENPHTKWQCPQSSNKEQSLVPRLFLIRDEKMENTEIDNFICLTIHLD